MVVFLDCEINKIDVLVVEQQRLIELLKEKRQAIISHAVTKGLNSDAPMKDSGIEWLGEVPAHWEIRRLGLLCSKIGSGKTPFGGAEIYENEGVVFIRSQNVYDEGLLLDDVVYISNAINEEMSCSQVQVGDILLNITGASLGRTCLVPEEVISANVNQHVCIIRLNDPCLREYVAMALKASFMKVQFDVSQTGAAREGLNYSQISGLCLALPEKTEIPLIVDYIKEKINEFDMLVIEAQQGINLLQERRTALISAVVTGKIDVRGLVASHSERELALA